MFKSFTSVHEEPFQDSVSSLDVLGKGIAAPPKDNAAVCVPAPAQLSLAVFKSPTSVQSVQSQISALALAVGFDSLPPQPKAAVEGPAEAVPIKSL